MLSQTSLYAIQALAYLAEHRDEGPILVRTVGAATGVPGNYLSKLMHGLGAAGILTGERGKKGGYQFAREPGSIRLIEVVNLFQNTAQFRQCLLGRPQCSDASPCGGHARWKPVSEAMIRFLEETTVADLASGRRRTTTSRGAQVRFPAVRPESMCAHLPDNITKKGVIPMRALDLLMHEHRLIEQVLASFETYLAEVESGADVPIAELEKYVTFIREFADRCHHGKEEGILFAAMVAHGFPKESGPLGVMYAEHTEGRSRLRAMAEVASHRAWTPALRERAVEDGRAYIGLLRAHIQKEDRILYPMAERSLPAARMEKMAGEFDEFEANVMGKGVHEQYHKLAHELTAGHGAGHVHH